MEIVKVLGIDPSLRKTGLAVVNYNSETGLFDVSHCQVLINPQKYTGNNAIMNMLTMMQEQSEKECYAEVDYVLVESPATLFSDKIPSSVMAKLGHVSGGAAALFGISKVLLFQPVQWNKRRSKAVTHADFVRYLGNPDSWHYEKRIKNEKNMEHVLDAASMATWWLIQEFLGH